MSIRKSRTVILQEQLADKQERLRLYKAMEKNILEGAPQSYGISTRNVSRYNMTLPDLRAAIKTLEEEIAGIEAELAGSGRRKAVGVLIRDW